MANPLRKLAARIASNIAHGSRRTQRLARAYGRHCDLSHDAHGVELAEQAEFEAKRKAEAFEALADWLVP